MEAVAYMLLGVALYAAGGLSIWVAYRSGRDDAHDERDRWEATEYRMTDVAPASVPEPLRLVVGGWTPPVPERAYSAERGPTPAPTPKAKAAPKERAARAPRKRTA